MPCSEYTRSGIFVSGSVAEFFQLPDELNPFGIGPWPCLNHAADHYRQSVIKEYQFGDRLRYGKPIASFSCECGFAYIRTGPDSSPNDRFRRGRIISFGPIWEAKLKHLWEDSSLSLCELGRRLGVDTHTIRKHALQLGLSFSRAGKEVKLPDRAKQLKGKDVSAWEEKRRSCRSKWLLALNQEQHTTVTVLRHKLPREYAWIQQNDTEWLIANKPENQRCHYSTINIDWERRDAEYVAAVKAVASRLKSAPDRPIRVTKTAIGRAIGAISLLQQYQHKLPLTIQVLEKIVETKEAYAIRRVQWVATLYCQECTLPREWQLISRASVKKLMTVPKVKRAIKAGLEGVDSFV